MPEFLVTNLLYLILMNYYDYCQITVEIGCGQAPYPGVYTRTASFMNWIRTNALFEEEERRTAVAYFF